MKDPETISTEFFRRVRTLQDKLGPILFQLPPHWKYNGERLLEFLKSLPHEFRYAFEFREPSWWNDEAYALLAKYKAAFCIYELNGVLTANTVTTDFVYIRLHGPGAAYQGSYSESTLKKWARQIEEWISDRKNVFCYFDNDQYGFAAHNALRLKELLDGN